MASIALGWAEINVYRATVGPGVGRPLRPTRCVSCGVCRIWFNGWRVVFSVVLIDGTPARFDEGLPLQRVKCSGCRTSWTLLPAFLYPQRSFAPDVPEAAALAYLSGPSATYRGVAKSFDCSPTALWWWIGWIASLAAPAAVLAEIARVHASTPAPSLVPRAVPQDHFKAVTLERGATLLHALQLLTALVFWARSQLVPPSDPSPLRFWLVAQLRASSRASRLADVHSPAKQHKPHGPSG